jgi:hypothetical protein
MDTNDVDNTLINSKGDSKGNSNSLDAVADTTADKGASNQTVGKVDKTKLTQRLRAWFNPGIADPGTSHCAVIGPVASGKSALLASLEHCEKVCAHSYHEHFSLHIPQGNPAYRELTEEFVQAMDLGLDLEATRDTVKEPEFTLTAIAKQPIGSIRKGDELSTVFSTMDGGGGLLFGDVARDRELQSTQFQQASNKLEEILQDSDTIILCLPFLAEGIGNQGIRNQLHRRLYDYADRKKYPRLKRLVLCFTYYELRGVGLDTRAYQMLATRNAAKREMADYLDKDIMWLVQPLRYLHRRLRGEVWLTPVSSFGFVPGNGAPNYDEADGMLLTRAQPENTSADPPSPDAPYTIDQAMKLWRPFLTLDPFAFITTGVSEGSLLFPLHELGLT